MAANNSSVFVGSISSEPVFRWLPEKPERATAQRPAFLQFNLRVTGADTPYFVRIVAFHGDAVDLYPRLVRGQRVAVQTHYRKRQHQGQWVHEFVLESLTFLSAYPESAEMPADTFSVADEEVGYADSAL